MKIDIGTHIMINSTREIRTVTGGYIGLDDGTVVVPGEFCVLGGRESNKRLKSEKLEDVEKKKHTCPWCQHLALCVCE